MTLGKQSVMNCSPSFVVVVKITGKLYIEKQNLFLSFIIPLKLCGLRPQRNFCVLFVHFNYIVYTFTKTERKEHEKSGKGMR